MIILKRWVLLIRNIDTYEYSIQSSDLNIYISGTIHKIKSQIIGN